MNSDWYIYGVPSLAFILAAAWVLYLERLANNSKRDIERACKDPRFTIMAEIYRENTERKKGKAS